MIRIHKITALTLTVPALLLGLCGIALADVAVVVSNAQELIDAVEADDVYDIEVEGTIVFDSPYQGTGNALPIIKDPEGSIAIRGSGPNAALVAGAAGFRLAEVNINGVGGLRLENLEIRGFSTAENGAVVSLADRAMLRVEDVTFTDNQSGGNGGVLYGEGDTRFYISQSSFVNNEAAGYGGAIFTSSMFQLKYVEKSTFQANRAQAGCAIALEWAYDARLYRNIFKGPCARSLVSTAPGTTDLVSNTLLAQGGYALKIGGQYASEAYGNIFARSGSSTLPLCWFPDLVNELYSIESHGFNVSTDSSCGLQAPSDVMGPATGTILDRSGPLPLPQGVALDAKRPKTIPAFSLTCAMEDFRGLGIPQDGNKDGIFGCDMGAVEKQGGPDIGAPQTGAYYALPRPGEGYFVEMLGDGKAFVTFFTYSPAFDTEPEQAMKPRWFFGVGNVVGNSIVVQEFWTTRLGNGPEFKDYNPAHFQPYGGGSVSLVFADCASSENPGRAQFVGPRLYTDVFPPEPEPQFTPLYTRLVRLTNVVGCDGKPTSSESGLSGSFYAPERNGEGIIVQWLDEDRVLAVWYTFDPTGKQVWLISGDSVVDGNSVTLKMFTPGPATGFGENFQAEELELAEWGSVTLEYQDCNTVKLSYSAFEITLPPPDNYGEGEFTYTRLTQPAGTQCSL